MICVDHLTSCLPNKNWRWDKSAHLFTIDEDENELHSFAKRLGLKRSWFQGDHYDLCPSKYFIAINLGAILVDRRSIQMRQFLDNRIRKVNRNIKRLKENK